MQQQPQPSNSSKHHYAVIMAGGAGTRLWPLSRKARPKQFQAFTDEETLLQHMVAHVRTVIPLEHIFIMATPEFSAEICNQVPDLPRENLLFEPARRDNGPATLLAALEVSQRDPHATLAVVWSDHLIQNGPAFTTVFAAAFDASEAHPEAIVTIGAKPTSPDPTLGYIQIKDEVSHQGSVPVYSVHRFIEKPDLATAETFAASWEYFWNLGYKVMHLKHFLDSLSQVRPELTEKIAALNQEVKVGNHQAIADAYLNFEKESIEYMYTQHLKENLLVLPADLGWSDLGNWNILHSILKEGDDDLAIKGEVIAINSQNSLVFAKDRPITIVGVNNLVIVDDGDCILVMDRSKVADIKKVSAELETRNSPLQ